MPALWLQTDQLLATLMLEESAMAHMQAGISRLRETNHFADRIQLY